jgi:glycosyltransferase involved in cell wall biosynthesis
MFNEASTIGDVLGDLMRSFPHVLCVDDGSTDGSADVARQWGAQVVRHPVNAGQGAALQTGFDWLLRNTDFSYCVTFDADGQHHADDALDMVAEARSSDCDVVLASRFLGSTVDMPALRGLTLRAAVRFSRWHDGLDVTDTHNGLRVLSRTAVTKIKLTFPRMAYASELQQAVGRLGLSYREHPVRVTYSAYSRAKGQSNLNSINIMLDLLARQLRAAP